MSRTACALFQDGKEHRGVVPFFRTTSSISGMAEDLDIR
jgi:hypothetical protein